MHKNFTGEGSADANNQTNCQEYQSGPRGDPDYRQRQGRKWAQDSKYKYFTGESFAEVINRTTVLDSAYDDLGRPSERGGELESAFLRRPRAELSLCGVSIPDKCEDRSIEGIGFKGLGAESEVSSARDTKHCGGRRSDLGFGWRASVVYLEVEKSRDKTV